MSVLMRRLPNLTKQCVQRMSSTKVPPGYREGINPDLRKIKALQAKFQASTDVPMYLRGGKLDHAFYYFLVGCSVLAVGNTVYTLVGWTKD